MTRPAPHRVRIALLALAVLGVVTLAGCRGCSRQIHFTPAGSDSIGVHSADSLRMMVRHAQELWEARIGKNRWGIAGALNLGSGEVTTASSFLGIFCR